MLIWLKYKNGATETAGRFDAAIFEKKPITERSKFTSLRSRNYSFLISKRSVFYIEIGADELQDNAKKSFMDSFYSSELQFISEEQIATEPTTTFVPVIIEDEGTAPISYLENWDKLPEYKMTLLPINPD